MENEPNPRSDEFGTGLRAHMGLAAPADLATPPAAAEPATASAAAPARPEEIALSELEARSRALQEASAELEARERRLDEQQRELAAEAERFARQQAELEAELDVLTDPAGKPVPAVLRERAEQHVERLWRSLFAALDATRPDGSADFATRVSAARALLSAAYPGTAVDNPGPDAAEDELAILRARRRGEIGSA